MSADTPADSPSDTQPGTPPDLSAQDPERYIATVKLGPKSQIVIPKEARAMCGREAGNTLVLLADTKKGIAIQTADKLNPLLRRVFQQLPGDEEAEE